MKMSILFSDGIFVDSVLDVRWCGYEYPAAHCRGKKQENLA